jgi:hypothetical protein
MANDYEQLYALPLIFIGIAVAIGWFANNNPISNNVNVQTYTAIPINIILNANDIDGNPLIFEIVDYPSNGIIENFNNSTGTLIYTSYNDYYGVDTLTYRVRDSKNAYSNTATVTIEVMPIFGVNYSNRILNTQQTGIITIPSTQPNIRQIITEVKSLRINVLRVNMYWEAYKYYKDRNEEHIFFDTLTDIANAADEQNVGIIYNVVHQWYISSYFSDGSRNGVGFPHELVSYLAPQGTVATSNITRTINGVSYTKNLAFWFWYDFFRNDQSLNGKNAWQALWDDYYSKVVMITKDHKSTIGYGTLNEPNALSDKYSSTFPFDPYAGLGNYNAFIVSKIEEAIGSKNNKIIIMGEIYKTWNDPAIYNNMKKVVNASKDVLKQRGYTDIEIKRKLLFSFHLYLGLTELPQDKVNYITTLKDTLDMNLIIDEWNTGSNYELSPEYAVNVLRVFKQWNASWAFFTYDPVYKSSLKDTNYNWKTDSYGRRYADILRNATNTIYP